MSGVNKDIGKVEVRLSWDPSPLGAPDSDLDLIAATYPADDPHGAPAYLVHFGRRLAPDGTITLNRDSKDGKGLGSDEVMTFEPDRLSAEYGRVVVGVAIQQGGGRMVFGDVAATGVQVVAGYKELSADDFSAVADCTAAVVGEFVRSESGEWAFHPLLRGYDTDPNTFARTMGGAPS
jgi:tellurium resistance protein TerD